MMMEKAVALVTLLALVLASAGGAQAQGSWCFDARVKCRGVSPNFLGIVDITAQIENVPRTQCYSSSHKWSTYGGEWRNVLTVTNRMVNHGSSSEFRAVCADTPLDFHMEETGFGRSSSAANGDVEVVWSRWNCAAEGSAPESADCQAY